MKATLALLLLLFPLLADGATIELADGTTVTGDIQGTLVLGGQGTAKKEKWWERDVHGALLFLIEGKDVVAISGKGVERTPEGAVRWGLFASKKPLPATPAILALIERLQGENFGQALREAVRLGMVEVSSTWKNNPIGIALMGEYLREGGGTVVPALRIQTGSGLRAIRVSDVAALITEDEK